MHVMNVSMSVSMISLCLNSLVYFTPLLMNLGTVKSLSKLIESPSRIVKDMRDKFRN